MFNHKCGTIKQFDCGFVVQVLCLRLDGVPVIITLKKKHIFKAWKNWWVKH